MSSQEDWASGEWDRPPPEGGGSGLRANAASPSHFSNWLRRRFSDSQRFIILCSIAGFACGLAAVSFHLSIDWLFDALWHLSRALPAGWGLLLLVLMPAGGGLLVGLLLAGPAGRDAMGSGIPQTKAAYWRQFGLIPFRVAVWRFILGTLSVGTGNSLGREGPTVHLCAAIASKIGQVFGLAKARIQAMVPVGMGAGIAAAFNTPLAALFFVFEELLDDISSKALGGILIAVVISSVVERSILGENPAFFLQLPDFQTDWWMLLAIPMAVLAALLGHAFTTTLLWTRGRIQRFEVPFWVKPMLGGLMVGIIATLVLVLTGRHGVFGIGYEDLSAALNGKIAGLMTGLGPSLGQMAADRPALAALLVVLLLFAGKFMATILCYSFGGSGGLFAPVLFLGGMLGASVGLAADGFFGFSDVVVGGMALLGMGAFFAAVIRCPLTSILIIFELTYNYSLILPLMAGNMLAYYLSRKLRVVPIYDALLLQDRVSLKKMPSYRGQQDWRNLPVSAILTFDVVTVRGGRSVDESLAEVKEHPHHAYPVLDEADRVVGMVTHDGLLRSRQSGQGEKPVREILPRRRLISLAPDSSIRDAANTLVIEDVDQAPVISKKEPGKLLGIVTLHDIARQQNTIEETIGRA